MIGLQLTAQQLNTLVGQAAVQLRNACQNVLNLQEFMVAQGSAGLQAPPLSFNGTDSAALLQVVNYLDNVAQAYFGTAIIASDFDFDNAVAQVYGGQ